MIKNQHPATKGLEALLPMELVADLNRIAWISDNRCPTCKVGLGKRCVGKAYCAERVALVADKF